MIPCLLAFLQDVLVQAVFLHLPRPCQLGSAGCSSLLGVLPSKTKAEERVAGMRGRHGKLLVLRITVDRQCMIHCCVLSALTKNYD